MLIIKITEVGYYVNFFFWLFRPPAPPLISLSLSSGRFSKDQCNGLSINYVLEELPCLGVLTSFFVLLFSNEICSSKSIPGCITLLSSKLIKHLRWRKMNISVRKVMHLNVLLFSPPELFGRSVFNWPVFPSNNNHSQHEKVSELLIR